MNRYFVYCPENGYKAFDNEQEQLEHAKVCIESHLDERWSEEVVNVVMGVITHKAQKTNVTKPLGKLDEEGLDESGEYWEPDMSYRCNYEMKELESLKVDHLERALKMQNDELRKELEIWK